MGRQSSESGGLLEGELGRLFFRQFLECEHWSCDHMTQSILEKHVVLPAVETEGHLFQIGREMFRRDFMPRSSDTALQKRERIFDGVCMDFARNVDSAAVVDGLVSISAKPGIHHGPRIANPIVSDNHICIGADVFTDVLGERSGFGVFYVKKPQFSASLTDADNDVFFRATPRLSFPMLDAADVRFVHFNNTRERNLLRFQHGSTDAMAEVPCRLISPDFEDSLHLQRGDAFLRFADKECGDEPLGERQMRIVEDGSCRDGELRLAFNAAQHGFAVNNTGDFFLPAFGADWTVRPAQFLQELPALAIAVELRHKVRKPNARENRRHGRHGHAPMKRKKKKTDRQVLKELFPPEIVKEVDAVLEDLNPPAKPKMRSNPPRRPLKPWGRKWVEEKKAE